MTTPIAVSLLEQAGESLGDSLPRFAGALALLIVGLLLAGLISRLLRKLLIAAGTDSLAERIRLHDALARAGLERSASRLVAFLLRIGLSLAVVFAAVSLLGIRALDESLNEAILFLPRLVAAFAVVLAGIVLASFARERVERAAYQMDLNGPLGPAVQAAVLGIAVIVALGQVGIPTQLLVVLAGTVAAGAVLTFTLAFGLGGRELAREVSAGRFVDDSFEVGQEVTVAGQRGEIVAIDTASTVLSVEGGDTVRVPNHLFLEAMVRVHV